MKRLKSDFGPYISRCPFCNKERKVNEYCIQYFTEDGMFCETSISENATIIYKDPNIKPKWGTLENIGFAKYIHKKNDGGGTD